MFIFRIHWIPPEFFEIPSLSKSFVTADVWALGTTLWEVFSYGTKPSEDLLISAYKTVGLDNGLIVDLIFVTAKQTS